jgi:hypothetical protein
MKKFSSTLFASKPAIAEPPVKVKPAVDVEVLSAIQPETLEDSFVYVHCHFNNPADEMLIRIWRTTFLIDQSSTSKSSLIHAENISFAPMWTVIPDRTMYTFLLIFSALPKGCKIFDLVEEIAQPGGFDVRNIQRNQQDVYHINI